MVDDLLWVCSSVAVPNLPMDCAGFDQWERRFMRTSHGDSRLAPTRSASMEFDEGFRRWKLAVADLLAHQAIGAGYGLEQVAGS